MTMDPEQAELLAQVAHLYFEKGDDQSAIARLLRVSRSSVSRLLTQARKTGIVEIRVHYPMALVPELSAEFCKRFGLQEALILKASRAEAYNAKEQVARLAARYLEDHLTPSDIVAIGRGSTLYATVEQLVSTPSHNVVVQLIGMLHPNRAGEDDANLARALAQKTGGEYYNLTAPLFVENIETRLALVQEKPIGHVLEMARQAQLALVGIGALDPKALFLVRQKFLSKTQVEKLRKGRAVGEICSQYFNLDGEIVLNELSERTIALEIEALKKIPRVVGVATGAHKAKAILGALRGGYVGVMITDDLTARLVLELDRPRARPTPAPARRALSDTFPRTRVNKRRA